MSYSLQQRFIKFKPWLIKPWLTLGTVLAILWLLIFSGRLVYLHHEAAANSHNTLDPKILPAKTETQQLFEALMARVKTGFVSIETDGTISLPAKDYILARKVANQAISDSEASLLSRLYHSIAGKAVQQQIAFWNHSRRFVALRDNLPQAGAQTTTRWQVRNQWDENAIATQWVPLSYGYINGGRLQAGFNDWISVANKGVLHFQTELNLAKKRRLQLQVIGQPDISRLPNNATLAACYPLTKNELKRGKTPACHPVKESVSDSSAYVISLTLPAGKHRLVVPVSPAINQEKKLAGLPIYLTEENQYAWEAVQEYHRNPVLSEDKNYRFIVKTQDGIALTHMDNAKPTRYTRDKGLVTLVGYERSDRYALSGLLSRSKLPRDKTEIHLTLDSRLQALAQKHLQKEMPKLGKNKEFAQKRRAAVVLMNPTTGAILAAANYPNPPAGIHRWDRISFSQLYPNRDPFGVNAWQGLDNHNAPGSTFKTVTAMAALQATDEGREDLEKMLKGLNANDFEQHTGLAINAFSYQADPNPDISSTVRNAGNAGLHGALPHKNKEGKTVYPALRIIGKKGCPSRPSHSDTLGLKEAVRDSLNIWFARLGVMMDENNLETGGIDTHLAAMSRLLGFGSLHSLSPKSLPLQRIYGGKGRGDILNAYAGSLSLDNVNLIRREQQLLSEGRIEINSALQRLTQNSFGQGVATTPLQMARVMASIATGYTPKPYLFAQWDGQAIDAPERQQLKIAQIDYLRQGMKAVTEAGTARAAFNKHYPTGQCRTYGKTGTAQLGRGKHRSPFHTAWFVGWREDINKTADVSFACMVTHAYASGKDSGGTVCAPIIARILNEMDKKPAKQAAKQ